MSALPRNALLLVMISTVVVFSHSPIFVPDRNLPISTFTECKSTDSLLVFAVADDVLGSIGNSIGAAWRDSAGCVRYLPAESLTISVSECQVALHAPRKGDYVVISPMIQNSLPITTHWRQSLNGGKGGFQFGASDSIGSIVLDTGTGCVRVISRHTNSGYDELYYNDSSFALFDSADATTPRYDSYCGENYALYRVDDRAAMSFSNSVLATSKYPVAFHNSACQARENVPAVQVVNNMLVQIAPDKSSLVTVLLPPYWKRKPSTPYPVIFNGFYDINANVYAQNGASVAMIISEKQYVNRGGAIGVLWNGGGSYGTYSLSPSAYALGSRMFDMVADSFGGDKNNIVAFGQSRGGITALALAGNPYYDNYRIRYVLALNTPKRIGDDEYRASPLSCAGMAGISSVVTGNNYGWNPAWIDPCTHLSSQDLVIRTVLGKDLSSLPSDVRADTADSYTPFGAAWMRKLKERGAIVSVASGTHDIFSHFSTEIEYVNKLRSFGVPTAFHIGLGAGHNPFISTRQPIEAFLGYALGDSMTDATFTTAQTYSLSMANSSGNYTPYSPPCFPMFFEGPRYAWRGMRVSYCIAGPQEFDYQLSMQKIDDQSWTNGNMIEPRLPIVMIMAGRLPDSLAPSFARTAFVVPDTCDTGMYVYSLRFRSPGSTDWSDVQNTSVSNSALGANGLLEILGGDPSIISASTLSSSLNPDSRNISWGLCQWKDTIALDSNFRWTNGDSCVLTPDKTWHIDGVFNVPAGKSLIVNKGTWVWLGPAAGAGTRAGSIVVEPGARLYAVGTVDSPIVFTARGDDKVDKRDLGSGARGLWGGIFILGRAGTSRMAWHQPDGSPNAGEAALPRPVGLPADTSYAYSGFNDGRMPQIHDSDTNGILSYVSIRHGGMSEDGTPLPSLGLYACGSGTMIDHLEAFAGRGDGIAIHGGQPSLKYCVSDLNSHEYLSVDEGFRGRLQYFFALESEYESDCGFSHGGACDPTRATRWSRPMISNFTLIGPGNPAPYRKMVDINGNAIAGQAIRLRDSTAGFYANGIVTEYPGPGIIRSRQPCAGPCGASVYAHPFANSPTASDDYIAVRSVVFDSVAATTMTTVVGTSNTTSDDCAYLSNPANGNQLSHMNRILRRISRGRCSGPKLDPRPRQTSDNPALAGAFDMRAVDPWFEATGFKGAFSPTDLWIEKWTALDVIGMLAGRVELSPSVNTCVLNSQDPLTFVACLTTPGDFIVGNDPRLLATVDGNFKTVSFLQYARFGGPLLDDGCYYHYVCLPGYYYPYPYPAVGEHTIKMVCPTHLSGVVTVETRFTLKQ